MIVRAVQKKSQTSASCDAVDRGTNMKFSSGSGASRYAKGWTVLLMAQLRLIISYTPELASPFQLAKIVESSQI